MNGILLYAVILIVKVIEVSLGTLRIVLITRGVRKIGALLGFFEVLIWITLVSTVLDNVADDPIKVVIYALGFALGNYIGSLIEQKLAIGTVRIEAIVTDIHGAEMAQEIRNRGYAVTIIDAKGMSSNRSVLIMHIKRKDYNDVVEIIRELQENVVITINDIKPVYGGYGTLKR